MHPVSKIALAVALGAFSMVPAAHAANDKDKGKPAAAAPQVNYSDGFKKVYGPFVGFDSEKDQKGKALKPEKYAENVAKAKAAWPQIRAAAATDDDKVEAGRFGVNIGLAVKDSALTNDAIDLALTSSTLPPERRPLYMYVKADGAYSAKDYTSAAPQLVAAYEAGYRGNDIEYMIALSNYQLKKFAEAGDWIAKAIATNKAANKPVPAIWYAIGGEAASGAGNVPLTHSYYAQLIAADNKPNYWYAALETYRRFEKPAGEAQLDILRLMRRTNALDAAGYEKLIDLLDQHRYPVEVEAVIAEGTANEKLANANIGQAKARAASAKVDYIASLPEAEANARADKGGFSAMLAGDDFFSNGDYAKARDLYALALSRGTVKGNDGADMTGETILRLGISKLYLGDVAGALAEFGKVNDAALKPIANYWAIHANQLPKTQG